MIEKIDGIFRTECVSFPRSGHHALRDALGAYFGASFHYCETYTEPEKKLEVCPLTNYQKNHDFKLDTPIRQDRLYLVQIRNPLASVQSWIDLDIRTGERPRLDSHEDWHRECASRLRLWTAFVEKWYCQRIPNRLIVQYERLIERPIPTCVSVIQFLTGKQNVDMDRLDIALEKFPICARPDRTPFWASVA